MNYSIPPIFTGLNNAQKNEYSYRDRWEKWREHLKKKTDSLTPDAQEAKVDIADLAQKPSVFRQQQQITVPHSPSHDAEAAALFHTTLLTRG